MSASPNGSSKLALRQQAEERLRQRQPATSGLQPAPEQARLSHELSVYEIELELQNEELRNTQAILEAERAHYFDFYNLAPVGYLTVNKRGLIIEANLTIATMLGLSRSVLLQQPFARLISREDLPVYHQLTESLFVTSKAQSGELRLVKHPSTPFPVQLAATAMRRNGDVDEIRLILSDISERKRNEEALRQSEERFRHLLKNVPEIAVQGYDRSGRTTYWNKASEALYGYTEPEALGHDLLDLIVPAEMKEDIRAAIQQMVESGVPVPASELSLHRKDGTRVPVYSSHSIVRAPGLATELFCLDIDLTERKQAEALKAKLAAHDQQLQKTESLERMAGAIAHHFNNQLQVVMMRLELIAFDLPRNHPIAESLAEAMSAARKAADVSTLMLTYLGQAVEKNEPVDLAGVCTQCLPLLRGAIGPKLVLEVNLPTFGPTISASAKQIQIILLNLVTNAAEACAERPTPAPIRLTVQETPRNALPTADFFPIDWQPAAANYACIAVADQGCGIAAKDIKNLFDPFFTSKFTGRGLGLPVVLGLLRSLGGVITLESEVKQGSTFRIFLPLTPETVAHQLLLPEQKTSALNDGTPARSPLVSTVLVIEDEPTTLKLVSLALRQAGYAVLEAANGHEALKLLRQPGEKIDGVLCDMTMQGMDGWETLTALRALKPGIPVILASGYSEALVMQGVHPELPNAFLQKPYEVQALKTTLRKILKVKS